MRRLATVVLLLTVGAPAVPAEAAYQAGAELVSASPERREQGDAATTRVDISEDGRFVAFETRARNFFADGDPEPPGAFRDGGVFRRDLTTGALELVAYGDLRPTVPGGTTRFGAHNPSISGDGRWIAFSTGAQLSAVDSNVNTDVYVRDMTLPIGDPKAYELVSARDGDDGPATYTTSGTLGSEVTPGAAISADGRMVAFRTRAVSDLPDTEPGATLTGQVLVRDRELRRTVLVTRSMVDGTPAGGLVSGLAPVGISADGSTIVWASTNSQGPSCFCNPVQAQTRFLDGEPIQEVYYLWRRIADGPSAPTRRITGVVDLDDPQCQPGSTVRDDPNALGPCYGPLAFPEGQPTAGVPDDKLPALSADGSRVAFLVSPYPRPTNQSGRLYDVFMTDMSAGVSRKAGTVELTQETLADQVSIQVASISGDGRRIAFVTSRTVFALPSPRLITPAPVRSADEADIYVIDLAAMEMERVTFAHDGGLTNGSVLGAAGTISLSADASKIAFLSGASNLFFGDSNSATDAFVLSEVDPNADAGRAAGEPPFPEIGPPTEGSTRATPGLGLKVKRRGSSLRVTVRVPGGGRLAARARGRVPPGKRLTTVASGRARTTKAGSKTFTVRPARRFRRALRGSGVVRTRLVVTFTPTGGGAPITARRTISLRG